ncbi:MAG: nucleotide exchange factor GrpE [Bacteroidia bacterium]|nr:nucleotide exchange factor GrpE [Bacteroidia bacterium]
MQNQENNTNDEKQNKESVAQETDIKTDSTVETDEKTAVDKTAEMEAKVNDLNDKYLRLYSEFDNYRKRTLKERSDIIKTASEDVFKAVLPVLDDLERAIKANEKAEDLNAIKEGVHLILNKFKNITTQKGLIPFESIGETFNPDVMEAITNIPASSDEQKGKVVDEVEKGYKLGDKVIRFAKVIIAQ